MRTIAIIGSGSWGVALAIHLAKMGHNVYMSPNNKNIADYLLNELGFHEYFGG